MATHVAGCATDKTGWENRPQRMVCVKGATSLFVCVAEALKPEEPEEKEFHRESGFSVTSKPKRSSPASWTSQADKVARTRGVPLSRETWVWRGPREHCQSGVCLVLPSPACCHSIHTSHPKLPGTAATGTRGRTGQRVCRAGSPTCSRPPAARTSGSIPGVASLGCDPSQGTP